MFTQWSVNPRNPTLPHPPWQSPIISSLLYSSRARIQVTPGLLPSLNLPWGLCGYCPLCQRLWSNVTISERPSMTTSYPPQDPLLSSLLDFSPWHWPLLKCYVFYFLNVWLLSLWDLWGLGFIFCSLPTKVHIVKAMVFPVVMYRCESWTIKKVEHWRIDAFKLWCWRGLLRAPWTARRSDQSILKETNLEYSLEGLMLKLQYFGHLM